MNAGPNGPKASKRRPHKAIASIALFDRVSRLPPTVDPVREVVDPFKTPSDRLGGCAGYSAVLATNMLAVNDDVLGFVDELQKS